MQPNHSFSDIDTRAGLEAYLGNSGFNSRDLYDTFGWIEDPDEEDFYATYLRNPVAKAVVDKPAETTWREYPDIQDTDDENTTDFEASVEQLQQRHQIWSYANRIDQLAGIGEYGVLVIGFADGRDLAQPVDTSQLSDPSDIAWLRVFPQISVTDIEFEQDQSSPRWGMPVEYDIDLSDADDAEDSGAFGSVTVHHERIIHVPSTELLDDEVRGTPRQEPVFNPLNDIEKVVGSVSELAYRGADYGLHIDVDPEYDFDPDDLNEELQRYVHQVQNFIKTQGASVETLGGEIADPSGIVDTLMSLISAQTGIPKRMLMGSEQGELASSQDVANYFGRISERQTQYAEQHIVRSLIDRLREFGLLPEPENGIYDVEWPNLFELNELEEADVKNTRAQTLKNMAPQGNTDLVATAEKRVEFIESGDASVLKPDDAGEDMPTMPAPGEETPEQQEAFNDFFLNESVDRTPPEQAQTNAEAVLDIREKTDAMTETGWRRAEQLAGGEALSESVIQKMAQFKRHQSNTEYENYSDIPESKKSGDNPWWEDNGTVAWLGWGGTAGIEWAVEQSEKLSENVANANRYDEGDTVSTPQGVGVVLEAITEGTVDGKDASDSSPVYAVAVEDERVGTGFYRASQIHATTIDTAIENPEEDIQSNSTLDWLLPNRDTTFDYPETWVKSDTPARIILLKAWSEMGGTFRGCRSELGSKRLCASMKDRVVGSEEWRGGWANSAIDTNFSNADSWNPELHPRDPETGQFVEKSGSVSAAVSEIEQAVEAGDLSAAERAIIENTSLESVDLSNLPPGQMADVARELAGLDKQGALDNVNSFQTTLPDGVDSNAIGHYGRESREVSIKGNIATPERLSQLAENGFLAGGTIEHLIRHEVGHAEHFQALRDVDPEFPPQATFNEQTQDLITDELGSYAAENGLELVAEVFAIRAAGGEVPGEILQIYNSVGGVQP